MQTDSGGQEKMCFEQYTLKQMSDALASDSPAPGGGTAAALSAMFGAALVEMVVNLSLNKAECSEHHDVHVDALKRLSELRAELSVQMDKDTAAFNAVMAAFKSPKTTDAEKATRTAAIRQAFYDAALMPLTTATLACAALEIVVGLRDRVNENAASDLLVGAEMCYAGFRGSIANVAINLSSIRDEIKLNFLTAELGRIKAFAIDLITVIRDYFHEQPLFEIIKE